ncbi:hypothetical protein DFS33DRAFT_997850 [Desarmillaria ectypa]|nr:hypothetical protein DFS33DRAFT_997850 [Desarmillaria ectypa]
MCNPLIFCSMMLTIILPAALTVNPVERSPLDCQDRPLLILPGCKVLESRGRTQTNLIYYEIPARISKHISNPYKNQAATDCQYHEKLEISHKDLPSLSCMRLTSSLEWCLVDLTDHPFCNLPRHPAYWGVRQRDSHY